MKIITPKNLIGVFALAIMLLGARTTFAYVPGVWDPQPRVQTYEPGFIVVPMPADQTPNTQVAQSQDYYSNNNSYNNQYQYQNQNYQNQYQSGNQNYQNQNQRQNQYVNTNTTTSRNTNRNTNSNYSNNSTYSNTPNNSTNYSNQDQYGTSNSSTNSLYPASTQQDSSGSDLTALSIQGNGGFLPSSFWQWLAVVFLILVIIIIFRSFKKQDPHHAPAH